MGAVGARETRELLGIDNSASYLSKHGLQVMFFQDSCLTDNVCVDILPIAECVPELRLYKDRKD